MAFAKAERAQLYLRCALFGPSGSGKTMTALRMAKGIAEKMGTAVAVIDTEARSASKYADRFAFEVDNLQKKAIDNYLASMNEAREAGYKVLVIDSLSHAWRELTEEVDRLTQASNSKNSLLSWGKVGPKQKRFIDAILNYPGHVIVTMRSKTEWVIVEGRNGRSAPEKLGLAPEQGKGIEYEFDLLVELNQNHHATITKDRTGKYQDETIEKPGEDFGVALYEWLISGKEEKADVPVQPAENDVKSQKTIPAGTKPKPEKSSSSQQKNLKEKGKELIEEIGQVITAESGEGVSFFTEEEKEEARQIISGTRLDEKGLTDLRDFKVFLSDELTRRAAQKAA